MDVRGLFAPRFEAGQSVDRAEAGLVTSLPELSDERHPALWLYARCLRKVAPPLRSGGGGLVHEARVGLGSH
jgi:hypothetical protein